MHAKQITVRSLSPELVERLKQLSETRKESINSTVLYILRQALDVHERRRRLARYATWSEEDQRDFDDALAAQRQIDESLWP